MNADTSPSTTTGSTKTRNRSTPCCKRQGSARYASRVLWVAAGRVPAPYVYRVVLIGAGHPTNFQGGVLAAMYAVRQIDV